MPSWNELLDELEGLSDAKKTDWLRKKLPGTLQEVSRLREGRNVILYASAFLQKPAAPVTFLQLTHEELNGFMSVMYGMDWSKGLVLLLHTPGGVTNATETIVDYLWRKFDSIEAIVPTLAMSAGTMICLSANRVIMGRQSQLGPIDPQMMVSGRAVSARAIVDQFDRAKTEISQDRDLAHVWFPILNSIGPSLLQEAQNALDYGEEMVSRWLAKRMFGGQKNAASKASKVASYFNAATQHKSHGRRIDRDEARNEGVIVEDLEDDQGLQEAVLTAYHLCTLVFEKTPATKFLWSNTNRSWVKNYNPSK